MKIRIKGNSIRLRLSQEQVTALVNEGSVTQSCELVGGVFNYKISNADVNEISVKISGSEIECVMPSTLLEGWDTDTRVGFDHEMPNGTFVLVEKDFKCLIERTHEDETDLYPNPRANQ